MPVEIKNMQASSQEEYASFQTNSIFSSQPSGQEPSLFEKICSDLASQQQPPDSLLKLEFTLSNNLLELHVNFPNSQNIQG